MKYAIAAALVGVAAAQWEPVDDFDWDKWTPPKPDVTTGKCSYVQPTTTHLCHPKKTTECRDIPYKTTIYAETCTWSDWVDPATKTTKWNTWKDPKPTEHKTTKWNDWEEPKPTDAKCSYTSEKVYTKCHPHDKEKCYEKTKTLTVYPTDCAEWDAWTKTKKPVEVTITKTVWDEYDTKKAPVVVTETKAEWSNMEKAPAVVTVTPGWSKDGWFGPAWPTVKAGGCVENVVTSYGYPIWKPSPEAATTWETAKAPEPTKATTWETVKEPEPSSKATWEPAKEPAPTTVATWEPVKSPAPSSANTWEVVASPKPKPYKPEHGDKGHAPIAPNGNKWSMTYTPYGADGKCKTQEVIKKDIEHISKLGFTSVRVYSTDCMTLEYIGGACEEYNLKIILGVFISKTGIEGAKQQVKDIIAWAKWEIVELIVIGNEAVYQGFCKADDLAWFIKECKDEFKAAGYTGGCTTTEPLDQWEKDGKKYCEVVDVVSANLYAYFNKDTPAEKAGEFISAQITVLSAICPGKDTYVMESGWPSQGKCNGKACAGKDEQKKAIKSIQESQGSKIVFFSYENEAWKQPGQYGVEQYWGCADVFGDDKDYEQKPKDDKPKADKPKGDDKSAWSKW